MLKGKELSVLCIDISSNRWHHITPPADQRRLKHTKLFCIYFEVPGNPAACHLTRNLVRVAGMVDALLCAVAVYRGVRRLIPLLAHGEDANRTRSMYFAVRSTTSRENFLGCLYRSKKPASMRSRVNPDRIRPLHIVAEPTANRLRHSVQYLYAWPVTALFTRLGGIRNVGVGAEALSDVLHGVITLLSHGQPLRRPEKLSIQANHMLSSSQRHPLTHFAVAGTGRPPAVCVVPDWHSCTTTWLNIEAAFYWF